jgi:hypothetical protein
VKPHGRVLLGKHVECGGDVTCDGDVTYEATATAGWRRCEKCGADDQHGRPTPEVKSR